MAKKVKCDPNDGLIAPGTTSTLDIVKRTDEKIGRTLSRVTLDPQTRNASLAMSFGSQVFGDQMKPGLTESSAALGEEIQLAMKGDLSIASRIYTSHAISLDTLFTEMARRAAANMGEHPIAFERYMNLALKAQSACRTTLEAMARLHQPREQIVKHVHVNSGGQAVLTDAIHQHTGGYAKCKLYQTMPCNQSKWHRHRAAWPEHVRERLANRRLCRGSADVGCTAEQIPAHLRGIKAL